MRPIDAYTLNNELVSWYNDTEGETEKSILRRVMQMVVHAPTLTPPNEALTLEQLREMDGEPVYVVSYDYPQHTGWRIVRLDTAIDAPTLWDNEGGYFDSRHEYGKTWIAYRRPPEGEEDA